MDAVLKPATQGRPQDHHYCNVNAELNSEFDAVAAHDVEDDLAAFLYQP
jgi:hypothetical protein